MKALKIKFPLAREGFITDISALSFIPLELNIEDFSIAIPHFATTLAITA